MGVTLIGSDIFAGEKWGRNGTVGEEGGKYKERGKERNDRK